MTAAGDCSTAGDEFWLLRTAPDGNAHIVAIHNVSGQRVQADLSRVQLPEVACYRDLVSGQEITPGATLAVEPYQVLWLRS